MVRICCAQDWLLKVIFYIRAYQVHSTCEWWIGKEKKCLYFLLIHSCIISCHSSERHSLCSPFSWGAGKVFFWGALGHFLQFFWLNFSSKIQWISWCLPKGIHHHHRMVHIFPPLLLQFPLIHYSAIFGMSALFAAAPFYLDWSKH